jgi:hypothetical protein
VPGSTGVKSIMVAAPAETCVVCTFVTGWRTRTRTLNGDLIQNLRNYYAGFSVDSQSSCDMLLAA